MRSTRILTGALGVALAMALAAGCSNTPPAPSAPGAAPAASASSGPVAPEHNIADVAFVQGMIPHHSQAITMTDQAGPRAASPQVKDLAGRIAGAQGPEIEQMNSMLAAWGAPRAQPGSMTGMGSMPMMGMMGDQQLSQLAAAGGPAFDRMFLQMMIEHHQGAVTMAQTELAQGQNPQAQQLAQAIITAQQTEIAEMNQLLPRV